MNDNDFNRLLQTFVLLAPQLAKNETLGRLGAKLGEALNSAMELLQQRLDTDAGYAAGMRELAATAAQRRETIERGGAENDRLRADLDRVHDQRDAVVAQLQALVDIAEDPATDLSEATRKMAITALLDILKTLGAEQLEPADDEGVVPPTDTHRATAKCDKGHTWPCVWTVGTVTHGAMTMSDRIVFPPTCPTCSARWTEIEPAEEAPEEQPS